MTKPTTIEDTLATFALEMDMFSKGLGAVDDVHLVVQKALATIEQLVLERVIEVNTFDNDAGNLLYEQRQALKQLMRGGEQ